MNITLEKVVESDKNIVQNLASFYTYDMSRYCGFLPGWETPVDGHFTCFDLSRYWEESNRHPFLIKVDNELTGFVLIHKIGSTEDVLYRGKIASKIHLTPTPTYKLKVG